MVERVADILDQQYLPRCDASRKEGSVGYGAVKL